MRIFILLLVGFIPARYCVAQQNVAINSTGVSPHASAQLDISSTNKGILIPRMTSSQRTAIASPATGLMVFDTDTNSFWFYNGTSWVNLSSTLTSWGLNGNSGTNPSTYYLGTSDNADLRFKINAANAGLLSNNGNVFLGLRSGNSITTGFSNIAIGIDALRANTTINNQVAIGDSSLKNNTTGIENTAIGSKSLYTNTDGFRNTAIGFQSLYSNTIGVQNVAAGTLALYSNTSGLNNTGIGSWVLYSNTTGQENTAIGRNSLYNNSTGNYNTAVGSISLNNTTAGTKNSAFGQASMFGNTTGKFNTAAGYSSLSGNTSGNANVAIGIEALASNSINSNQVAVGDSALRNNTTGTENTAIGSKALYANVDGFRNTSIGFQSLYSNDIGIQNVAAGNLALYSNTSGLNNTAVGSAALYTNTTGQGNTASGRNAMYNNKTGFFNTAMGAIAMNNNTVGYSNAALGEAALFANTSGNYSTAIGTLALGNNLTGAENTGLGYAADVATGALSNATAIGARARVDCSNCLVLGSVSGVNSATANVNVGIGTTLPQQMFSVGGAMNIDQSNANSGASVNPGLTFGSASGEGIASKRNAGVNQYGLDFYTNFLNRMTINASGNVGIATNNPQSALHIANGGALRIYDATNTRYVQLFHSNTGNLHLDPVGGGSSYISWYEGSGLTIGNGTAAGYGPVNASAFVVSSSIVFKKDIKDIPYGLSQILQLQGKEYKYIDDNTNRNEIGLIAEDVEKVLPEVVYRNSPDKKITGIDYGKLTPVLIEAIKELHQQISELKKENAEIKRMLIKNN